MSLFLSSILGFALLAAGADLSEAPAEELMAVYNELRAIHAGTEVAETENVVFQRDSATFTFLSGRITFAAPVGGHILAAHFRGEGTFELQPPSDIDRRQMARYTGSPYLKDTFQEAVFFFTDDSMEELDRLVTRRPVQAAGDPLIEASRKRYGEQFNDWVDNRRRGNPVMRNLAARMLSDLTDSGSRGFFLADFKAKDQGDLLYHISWNRDSLLLPAAGRGEEVTLLHVNPGNYYEWVAGFHLASEYSGGTVADHHTLLADCESMEIELDLTRDNRVSAAVKMEFAVAAPVRVVPFHLNGVLRIGSIEDGSGARLAFIQEARDLDSDPWLILPKPAGPGEKYTITMAYLEDSTGDSQIVHREGRGLYYVTSRESWIPGFGAFNDRTHFRLRARSPKKFQFVASGARISSETVKDERITVWQSEIPFCVFGFNYGEFVDSSQKVVNLEVTAYAGKEVPDELKGVQAGLSLIELADQRRRLSESSEPLVHGIMTGGFSTAANVKHAASVSMQAFRLCEILYGPLPFKAVSITEQPVRGFGQSWPNLVFLPYDAFLDATTRHNLQLAVSPEDREFYNLIAVHEMAHQWWGHLVGWKTYHDQWLSEGFAEHAAALYLRQLDPKQWSSYWDLRRNWLLSKNNSGYRPVDAGPIWLNHQLDEYDQPGNSRLIYYKGAYVLEMLRALMFTNKEKDDRFIAMMRDFARSHAEQNASTKDFQRIVEKHMEEPMDWFFNQWVYGSEIPRYTFSYKLSDAGAGQTELAMTLVQSDVSSDFRMRLPLFALVDGTQRYLGNIQINGTEPYNAVVKLPMKPEKVLLDPDHSILAEIRQ